MPQGQQEPHKREAPKKRVVFAFARVALALGNSLLWLAYDGLPRQYIMCCGLENEHFAMREIVFQIQGQKRQPLPYLTHHILEIFPFLHEKTKISFRSLDNSSGGGKSSFIQAILIRNGFELNCLMYF